MLWSATFHAFLSLLYDWILNNFDFALKACAMGPVGLPRGEAGIPECLSAANCPYYRLSVSLLPTAHPASFVSSAHHLPLFIFKSVWLFTLKLLFLFCLLWLLLVTLYNVTPVRSWVLVSTVCFSGKSDHNWQRLFGWSITSCSDNLIDIRGVTVHEFRTEHMEFEISTCAETVFVW